MRRVLPFLVLLLASVIALGQDVPPKVVFTTEKATYKPGEDIKGTVTATFGPGLHGYQNPPSKDYMLPVQVKPGDGTIVKSVNYPAGHMEIAGGEEAAVYSGTVSFPVVIAAPAKTGKVTLNVGFFYQQCDASTCYIPNTIPVSADVTIEVGETAPPSENEPNKERQNDLSSARWNIVQPLDPVTVSSPYEIKVRIEPSSKRFFFIPDGEPNAFSLNEIPIDPQRFGFERRTVAGIKGWALAGKIETTVPMTAPASAGKQKVSVKVQYTHADANNIYQTTEFTSIHEVDFVEKTSEDPVPLTQDSPQQTTSQSNEGLLGFLNNALEKGNWALIIPAALLAGLALCLTPCVFPMIPVTVTFFSNQGGKTTGSRFVLGLFYALGITLTYGAVGGISAAAGGAVGQLFTKPWFVIALALLLVALALSMFDVYEIRLPNFIQKNLKGRSGPVGALIMGLLMGFAAAPCAGALVGAVAVKVAEIGSIPTGLGMFGLIGLGMGLPFMALATASSGAKAMPKSGGWLKTTKAVLGLLVLYFAFDYLFKGIGFRTGDARTNIAWLAIFGAFIAYMLFFEKSEPSKAVTTIKGIAVAAIGMFAGMTYAGMNATPATLNWIPYNEQTFQQAVASGKPIMIDGKADWCVQCREIEHGVFMTPEGTAALQDVYLMAIDWSTGVDQKYIDETKKRFNIVGLPHIVFMEPGGKNEFAVKDIKSVDELKGHLRKVGANP